MQGGVRTAGGNEETSGNRLSEQDLNERRERVFIVLAGFFLCAMTLLNVVGITRFIQLGPMALAVGVLPYPLTFLCTDLISELYGRKRANFLVWVGFTLNFFILRLQFFNACTHITFTITTLFIFTGIIIYFKFSLIMFTRNS